MPVLITDDGVIEVNFDTSTVGGVVEGRVIDPHDPPLGYQVSITVGTGRDTYSCKAWVDSEGRYRAVGVPAGRLTIQYTDGVAGYKRFSQEIGAGESVYQDIEITATGVIEFQVNQSRLGGSVFVFLLYAEVDVSEMSYSVYRDLDSQAVSSTGISSPVRVPFRGLDSGTYTLVAVAADVWTEEGIDAAQFATSVVELGDDTPFVEFEF